MVTLDYTINFPMVKATQDLFKTVKHKQNQGDCQDERWQAGVSRVLFSAPFIAEAQTELKIGTFVFRYRLNTRFVREEKVVESVSNGAVEENRYSRESFFKTR
jgi:hypothetical protein